MPWPQGTALLRGEWKALLGNAQMCLERGVEYGGEAQPGTVCSGDEKSRYVKL